MYDVRDNDRFCNELSGAEVGDGFMTVYQARYSNGKLTALRLRFRMTCVAGDSPGPDADPDGYFPYTGRFTWRAKPADGPSSVDLRAPGIVDAGQRFAVKAQTTWAIGQRVTFFTVDRQGHHVKIGERTVGSTSVAVLRTSLRHSRRVVARVNGATSQPLAVKVVRDR